MINPNDDVCKCGHLKSNHFESKEDCGMCDISDPEEPCNCSRFYSIKTVKI